MDKLLRYGMPLLIYYVAVFFYSMVVFGMTFSVLMGGGSVEAVIDLPMMLYGTCTVIYLFMWVKDREQTGYEGNEMPWKMWLLLPLIGLSYAVADIYALRGMLRQDISQAFFGLSPYMMDAINTLPMLFIALFVAQPICFEFLFRGLMQMRLREDMGKWSAIVVVTIVTYVISRSVGTTLFSIVLCFVYEYYRSLAASIIVSLGSSLGFVMLYYFNESLPGLGGEMTIAVPIMLLLSILACAFMLLMIHRKHESPY